MMTDDAALLRCYASEHSQEAFAELVRRHLPLVFSSAARQLNGDVHLASDVSQIVFATVCRDARRLSNHPLLTAWLYTATRHAVIDLVRKEKRRIAREQEAHRMQEVSISPGHGADWQKLRPIIDELLDELPNRYRNVVLLRFFQNEAFPEIGRKLGISDEAARKRVDRALEVLKRLLTRCGISSTSAALAAILSSETFVAAPAALASSIIGSSFAGTSSLASIAFMTATKIKAGMTAAVLLSCVVGLVWQHQTIAQLRTASSDAQNKAEKAAVENMSLVKARAKAQAEAIRLRGEVATHSARSEARDSNPATNPRPASLSLVAPTSTGVPRDPQQLTKLHQRYDPFLKQWGFTPAETDRWIELMMEKENIRLDLQDAMRDHGVAGGAKELENLRSKLTDPLWKQMKDMLGPEGFAAFQEYEQTSGYRGYLEPLNPLFAAAKAALSGEQSDQLLRAIIGSDHPQRINPSDLGTTSHIDWESVEEQANNFLSPAQQTILSDYLQHGKKPLTD